jgi:pimeloyl-ACP methyl ester carboxylesterase
VQALGDIETIRIDPAGTGGPPAPAIPYRPSDLATLLTQALEMLCCPEVDVLGLSLGGVVAQQLAWQHADRIRRVILVSTGTGAIMVPGAPSAAWYADASSFR